MMALGILEILRFYGETSIVCSSSHPSHSTTHTTPRCRCFLDSRPSLELSGFFILRNTRKPLKCKSLNVERKVSVQTLLDYQMVY